MKPLTDQQAKLHRYLCDRWHDPPSFQEIADYMGFVSKNGVTSHLKALASKGYVAKPDDVRSRGIKLLIGPDLDGSDIEIAGRTYTLTRKENHAGSQSEQG